jgi:hypothetical protein
MDLFSGPLMRLACADMRDDTVLSENDHRASHRRFGMLQYWSLLEINICEIFGDVRFSTFPTQSGVKRTSRDRVAMSAFDRRGLSERRVSALS